MSIKEEFGISRALSTIIHRGSYKSASKTLKDVMQRKQDSHKDKLYYASQVAKSYPGVDARKLAAMHEARVDKHEVSGKVVIDGHVFSDAGKSGRSTYGRYSVKDPNYVKDPKEVGMHRNYRKPSSLNFSTLADAKKWVKTQPKKSAEEIERIHKKHADFEKYMKEEVPVNNVGGGNVAGLGVGPQGEPGVKKRKTASFIAYMKRNNVSSN